MQHERQIHGRLGIKHERRAGELDPLVAAAAEQDLIAHEIHDLGALQPGLR